MRKLLLQLDTSPQPSVFDRIVAFDGGADEVMSYGDVSADAVRDFVHGAIFTRGGKALCKTAIFIGGDDISAGERLLAAVRKEFFGAMSVSVMLDANGSNTTAVAAVAKLQRAIGNVEGRRAIITGGTGAVGIRAAGLLAKAGADVTITSRHATQDGLVEAIVARFGGTVRIVTMSDAAHAFRILEGAEILLNAGPPAVCLVPRNAWSSRMGLKVAADLNAVPPLGIEGIEVKDDGMQRDGVVTFGAFGVGGLKMEIHKACISRLFERNDQILDAETIAWWLTR